MADIRICEDCGHEEILHENQGDVKPSVSYMLSEGAKKKYAKIDRALGDLRHIEELAIRITEKARVSSPKKVSDRKKIFSDYYSTMADASLAALETAVLEWEESEAPLAEAIASTSVSIARRILLLQDLASGDSQEIRRDVMEDRDRLIKNLEKKATG